MAFWHNIIALLASTALSLEALTSSVIIPCHHKHAHHLLEILQQLARQTRQPDEVCIALSGSSVLPSTWLAFLTQQEWPFPVRWDITPLTRSRGANRNVAALLATQEVLVCCDADDESHPQRIEVCLELMERNPRIQMVLHGAAIYPGSLEVPHTIHAEMSLSHFLRTSIGPAQRHFFWVHRLPLTMPHYPMCNGVPVFYRRWVSEYGLRWNESRIVAEDFAFNRQFLRAARHVAFINTPLYYYRPQFSVGYDQRDQMETLPLEEEFEQAYLETAMGRG